ncbi:MAG: AsmA family protein [Alphaproteobacteria bacterium]
MKKVLIALGALVVLVVVALVVAPLLIPVDTYKTQILTQIEKATGRKARIDGDFSVSLFPRAAFTAGKFTLANAPGGTAPNMVSLEKLNVRVALLPLLGGNLVIDSFVMERPDINLEADRQGRGN